MVKVQESIGGLFYEGNTSTDGTVGFNCTFGKYIIKVYDAEGVALNETAVNLFQNQNLTLTCKLWGLTVSIKLVDYFGQPISNVKITLQRENRTLGSQRTLSDGTVRFDDITGGTLQAVIYLFDDARPYMTQTFYVGNSATIGVKLEEYVLLAGFFVETSALITVIIILASVIVVLLVEVYRRRHKSQHNSS
jgi:hypothetical protein